MKHCNTLSWPQKTGNPISKDLNFKNFGGDDPGPPKWDALINIEAPSLNSSNHTPETSGHSLRFWHFHKLSSLLFTTPDSCSWQPACSDIADMITSYVIIIRIMFMYM